jgi:hypothetical protein
MPACFAWENYLAGWDAGASNSGGLATQLQHRALKLCPAEM